MQILQLALSALLLGGQGPNPNSQFDWTIAAGETFVFNTVSQVIVSSPPQFQQATVGGFVDVRNFTIEDGGVLIVQGPNPMVLCASGQVVVDGRLSIDGTSSPGVVTLNTTNLPEQGAPGQGGGGAGGTGSPFTTMSSPRGGNGLGAFGMPDAGGQGGETGWALTASTEDRRGAGGGGGVFGANQQSLSPVTGTFEQSAIGLDAERGFNNTDPDSTGAISGLTGVLGGAVGSGPFIDSSARNDFFGTMLRPDHRVVHGELKQPWAGAGGGAGGDANRPVGSSTYPGVWSTTSDEKGAGGGGGAGSLRILALGPIVFGPQGEITANGGTGGGGENTLFLNRVGGGSGGGSGGHIILETADHIDLSQVTGKALRALGGQGGVGRFDVGGASISLMGVPTQTLPNKDACPPGYPSSGPNACLGHVDGAGGDGGPGLIQLHTPRGLRDITLAAGSTLDNLAQPRPVCWDGGCRMLVSFMDSDSSGALITSGEQLLPSGQVTLESLRMQSGL